MGSSGVAALLLAVDNRLTLPMSGTGSAAMEATLANTVEPGDTVLVLSRVISVCLADMAHVPSHGENHREALGRVVLPR